MQAAHTASFGQIRSDLVQLSRRPIQCSADDAAGDRTIIASESEPLTDLRLENNCFVFFSH